MEAREPDAKASGFAKSLSATCNWNFVKRQRRLFTEGDAKPSLRSAFKLCKVLGVAPRDVVGEADRRVEKASLAT